MSLLLGAFLLFHSASVAPTPPPRPPASATWPLPVGAAALTGAANAVPGSTATPPGAPAPLGPSRPTHIAIPRLGVDAALITVGLAADGSVGVPSDAQARDAAWYDGSATPGEAGPSVIVGHVDSWSVPLGRAAFYPLGAARPGDQVAVTRADQSVAVFTVDSVTLVPKKDFPTEQVYGAIDYPGLRLITCGGGFTQQSGYDGNVIVYAHLSGTHHV